MDQKLMHYGVLGMKWGVRRNRSVLRKKSNNKTKNHMDNQKEERSSRKTKKKKVSDLTDAELRQAINRLQMEKQLAQLTAKEKSAGSKFVSDVLSGAAKKTATDYTAKYMAKGMDALIKAAARQARN